MIHDITQRLNIERPIDERGPHQLAPSMNPPCPKRRSHRNWTPEQPGITSKAEQPSSDVILCLLCQALRPTSPSPTGRLGHATRLVQPSLKAGQASSVVYAELPPLPQSSCTTPSSTLDQLHHHLPSAPTMLDHTKKKKVIWRRKLLNRIRHGHHLHD